MHLIECPNCKVLIKEELNVLNLMNRLSVQEISQQYSLSYEEIMVKLIQQHLNQTRTCIKEVFLLGKMLWTEKYSQSFINSMKEYYENNDTPAYFNFDMKVKTKAKSNGTYTQRKIPIAFAADELSNLSNNLDLFLDPDKLRDTLKLLLYGSYIEGMEEIGRQTELNFRADPSAVDFIADYNFNLVKGLTDETREKLRGVIRRGLIQGSDTYTVEQNLVNQLNISELRAESIARTENNTVTNAGIYNSIMQSDLKGELEWDAHLDNRTSAICRLLDGQRINKDDPDAYFHAEVIGKKGKVIARFRGKHPSAHPFCRSKIKFIIAEEQD